MALRRGDDVLLLVARACKRSKSGGAEAAQPEDGESTDARERRASALKREKTIYDILNRANKNRLDQKPVITKESKLRRIKGAGEDQKGT